MLHKLVELLIESRYPVIDDTGLALLVIDPPHKFVDQLHDEIVIVATLTVLETETVIGVEEEIVL